MKVQRFRVTSSSMQPTLFKGDLLEGFEVETPNYKMLEGVYVIEESHRTFICRITPDNLKSNVLKISYDNGDSSSINVAKIQKLHKITELISRYII